MEEIAKGGQHHMTALGKFLRKLRIDNDEILLNMAEKLHVSPSFLSSVENGRKSPPPEWLDAITFCYNLDNARRAELESAMNNTINQVRLNLAAQPHQKRDMAITFARRFEAMDSQEVAEVLALLNRRDKKRSD